MKKVKYYRNEIIVFTEMLRRYVCFHSKVCTLKNEDMEKIECFGLFNYGEMNRVRKKGYIISDYKKEHKVCWCKPTLEIIENVLKPAFKDFLRDKKNWQNDLYMMNYEKYIEKYNIL